MLMQLGMLFPVQKVYTVTMEVTLTLMASQVTRIQIKITLTVMGFMHLDLQLLV